MCIMGKSRGKYQSIIVQLEKVLSLEKFHGLLVSFQTNFTL